MGRDGWRGGNRDGNRRGGFGRGGFNRGRGSRGRGFGGNQDWYRDGNRFNSNNQWQNRPKRDTPGKRLTEEQIGVTQYMSEHEGFTGIIKSRYSDFQVSEINEEGVVARLTTLVPPEPPAEEEVEVDEELLLSKYNVEILPMDTWDQINKVAIGESAEPVEIDVTKSSKEERTKIHDAVKKAFGDGIVGSTVNTDANKVMRFTKYKKGVRIDNRVKWTWPGEYVSFVLHKENCDTMEAAARLAERLRMNIKPSMLGYAGTKDRRAKTSQWFTARKLDPSKLAAAARDLRDVHLGDYAFRRDGLRLGMLRGNKFRIALRNVTADDAVVDKACALLRDAGFINYYGLQRFGTRVEVPTFEVGKKLLKGNYKEAIDSILSEAPGPLQAALRVYKAQGAACAVSALPRHCHALTEAKMLHTLADSPKDLLNALQRVPRNTRLLYLHSYQSLVWNRAASERLRRGGLTPIVGDLVPLAPQQFKEETTEEESDSEESSENTEKTNETPAEHNAEQKISNTDPTKEKVPVKVLTQEDVDSNSYTIFDVILPLPGYLIDYPPNMKDYYEKLLTEDGLTLQLRNKHKSYSMSGAYRHVAVRPADVSWRRVHYSDPYADLILSDLDDMRGNHLTGILQDGEYKALLLTFSLPASCYATMALRELTRVDTASHTQAAQNDYHKRKKDAPAGPPAAAPAPAPAPAADADKTADAAAADAADDDADDDDDDGEPDEKRLKIDE